MIWSRLSIIQARFGLHRAARARAAEHARIWQRAARAVPEILPDLIREGGLLQSEPVTMIDGSPEPAAVDPGVRAYMAGRADLARQILAAAGMTADDLQTLLETHSHET